MGLDGASTAGRFATLTPAYPLARVCFPRRRDPGEALPQIPCAGVAAIECVHSDRSRCNASPRWRRRWPGALDESAGPGLMALGGTKTTGKGARGAGKPSGLPAPADSDATGAASGRVSAVVFIVPGPCSGRFRLPLRADVVCGVRRPLCGLCGHPRTCAP